MKVKKAGLADIEVIVELRKKFISELHPEYDSTKLKDIGDGTRSYLQAHLKLGDYLCYLGIDESGNVFCTAAILAYLLPPLDSAAVRKIGHVLNVWTDPTFRKQGYGSQLIESMIEGAEAEGFTRLVLNATDQGLGLYKKYGFKEPSMQSMQLAFH
jgi:ribosomal protein S18 acetylase RimI-like enzyme